MNTQAVQTVQNIQISYEAQDHLPDGFPCPAEIEIHELEALCSEDHEVWDYFCEMDENRKSQIKAFLSGVLFARQYFSLKLH